MEWWWVAIPALAVGLAGGFFWGRRSNAALKQSQQLDQDLRETREELSRYRARVAEHFSATADLFNTMTANYRSVYEHLATGAQKLCGDPMLQLESAPDKALPPVSGSAGKEASNEPALSEADEPEALEAGDESEGWYEGVKPDTEVTDYPKERGADSDRLH